MNRVLGVIGGSGIYDLPGLLQVESIEIDTPFGKPSDAVVRGVLGTTTLVFLPRHGRGHRIPPHAVNYRANVCALKKLGAEQLVSLSAVGSMREEIHPGDVVIVDQYCDLTKRRVSTFFDRGVVAHVTFADPVDPALAQALGDAAEHCGARVHRGGTYVCIEGPQFSSRAESIIYRSWGVSVIGMTALPEAKLAREAELPYATMALATDYDCWHDGAESVTVEAVLEVLSRNSERARRTIAELAKRLPDPARSPAARALEHALITARSSIGAEARAELGWLIDRYLARGQS